MNRSTLPHPARAHAPGWTHPYPANPFSPVFYADGDEDEPDDDTGEGDDDGHADDDPGDDGDADPDGANALGEKGKRALASMKGKWRSERDKRRAAEEQLAAKADDDEAAASRREVEQAAMAKANARIVKAEVKAAATGRLADPADAYKFLDLDQFEVDDDGNLDSDEVAEAIEELIKSKPYLAAAQGGSRFQGTGDGGAARNAGRPKQLSRADLKRMSPEEIVKAKAEGRLDKTLGITR